MHTEQASTERGGPGRPRVLVCTTGHESELVQTVPITTKPGQTRRVVMSLGPAGEIPTKMPDLAPGDRLELSAEVEVTTDCKTAAQGGCVGPPYAYDPMVQPRLLLASSRDATQATAGRAIQLAEPRALRCTHDEHHKVLVLRGLSFTVPERLSWPVSRSCLNLVLEAYHPQARRGHVLLVGENEPTGAVVGDKGRINVVRLRGSPRGQRAKTAELRVREIPPDKSKWVALALRLDGLREGEQILAWASLTTSAEHLPYWARISTRLLLADDPGQTDVRRGRAKRIAALDGEVGEHNGFNCRERCTTRRVGVLSLLKSAEDAPLYLNLVADGGDPLRRARSGDKLRLLEGALELVRYRSDLKG